MKQIIKNILRENAGISFVPRIWVPIIIDEISQSLKDGSDEVIIDGTNYPEQFEQFPVDFFVFDLGHSTYEYLEDTSGYDKDGYYVVHMRIPKSKPSQTVMNHEMKHAYQDFMRQSKGSTKISQSKEIQQLYTPDFVQVLLGNKAGGLRTILNYYYKTSKFEDTAYLENIYDESSLGETYIYEMRNILKEDFDYFKMYEPEFNYLKKLDIPLIKKFKTIGDFIDYSEKYLKRRAEKILKKINKMKYVHGKVDVHEPKYDYGDYDDVYSDEYEINIVYDELYNMLIDYQNIRPNITNKELFEYISQDPDFDTLGDIYNISQGEMCEILLDIIEYY